MKTYFITECAWHKKYWGYNHIMGMKIIEKPDDYKGDKIQYSDGICDICIQELLKENKEGDGFV